MAVPNLFSATTHLILSGGLWCFLRVRLQRPLSVSCQAVGQVMNQLGSMGFRSDQKWLVDSLWGHLRPPDADQVDCHPSIIQEKPLWSPNAFKTSPIWANLGQEWEGGHRLWPIWHGLTIHTLGNPLLQTTPKYQIMKSFEYQCFLSCIKWFHPEFNTISWFNLLESFDNLPQKCFPAIFNHYASNC